MKKKTYAAALAAVMALSCACTAFAATQPTPAPAPASAQQTTQSQSSQTAQSDTASTADAQQEAAQPKPANVSTANQNDISTNNPMPSFDTLKRIETMVYGSPRDGGLFQRVNDVERNVFGRELPGSLTERQAALLDFLEKGTGSQPSVLFKMAVAEWAVEQKIHPTYGLMRRVDYMEALLEGAVKGGPLVSRLEKLLAKLLPDGIKAVAVELPKETIVKAMLLETMTVRNVKVGDTVILGLNEPIIVNGVLVAPKGSRVFGHVTKVKMPRSFGRPAEINMLLDTAEVLGPSVVPVNLGEVAKKAMQIDSGIIGAAGTSIAGAVLLGPVGLAGGFLIRGNDKQLKEGTLFYVQTTESCSVSGYTIPTRITPMTQPAGNVPQGTKSAPAPIQ